MRTSDFSAYDEMRLVDSNSQTNYAFRGLYITNNDIAVATISIDITFNRVNNLNQLSTVTKQIILNLSINDNVLLPLSGDGLIWNITSSPEIGQVVDLYALI
jgi:hypothetical protein